MDQEEHMRTKALVTTLAAGMLAVSGVLVSAGPAMAATAPCGQGTEVCYVTTTTSVTGNPATVKTSFPGLNATFYYEVRKGSYGAKLCSGYMGSNTALNCYIGSYTGTISFVLFKGQNSSGSISIN
jgi:hypothetical protein